MDRIELKIKMETETKKASDKDNGTITDVSEEYVKWLEQKLASNAGIITTYVCTVILTIRT